MKIIKYRVLRESDTDAKVDLFDLAFELRLRGFAIDKPEFPFVAEKFIGDLYECYKFNKTDFIKFITDSKDRYHCLWTLVFDDVIEIIGSNSKMSMLYELIYR